MKTRFILKKYEKELTEKDGFDSVPEAIEHALKHCEALSNSYCEDIATFDTREEGLKVLEQLINKYYHYRHFSRNRYTILLHTLEEEYFDEDFDEWCFSGDYDTISNWE